MTRDVALTARQAHLAVAFGKGWSWKEGPPNGTRTRFSRGTVDIVVEYTAAGRVRWARWYVSDYVMKAVGVGTVTTMNKAGVVADWLSSTPSTRG